MNTTANVKKVSLLFFIVLMGTHLFASLMVINDYLPETMTPLRNSLDIPAILSGILYAFSSTKLYMEETQRDSLVFEIVAGSIAGLLLVTALVFKFFL